MNYLVLGAFYDAVNKSVGPTLIWVFFFLLLIESIYVMIKYVNPDTDENKK